MNRTVIEPGSARKIDAGLTGLALADVFYAAWLNRGLLATLVRRDVESRYRGAALGMAWLVGVPLALLVAYTFVFGIVFNARLDGRGLGASSLALYIGIVFYQVFAESVNRAAGIVHENVAYVKRIVFPLRILPLVPMLTACLSACVSFVLFAVAYMALVGLPSWTWLLLPLMIIPLLFVTAGTAWLLAALGAYVRDVRHVAALASTVLMFLTPVLYPSSAVPEALRLAVELNPLAFAFESIRIVLLEGKAPDMIDWALHVVACWIYAALGYACFSRLQRGFADVV